MYAYEHVGVPEHEGAIKVGYTTRTAEERIGEQNRTAGLRYKILRQWSAMRDEQRRDVKITYLRNVRMWSRHPRAPSSQ